MHWVKKVDLICISGTQIFKKKKKEKEKFKNTVDITKIGVAWDENRNRLFILLPFSIC